MAEQPLNLISPLSASLPDPPADEVLTSDQWITLLSIGDAVIPAIASSSAPAPNALSLQPSEFTRTVDVLKGSPSVTSNPQLVSAYLAERPSDLPVLKELIHRTFADYTPKDQVQGISVILSVLK